MHIQNGTTVDPTWTNSIAISPDGSNWEHLSKKAISKVSKVFMLTNAENKKWNNNRDQRAQVHLMGSEGELIFSFDTQDIYNQQAWVPSSVTTSGGAGTATDFQSGLKTAISDIMSWI